MASMSSKRKRDSHDIHAMRPPPGMDLVGHEFDSADMHTDYMSNADGGLDFTGVIVHNADPNAQDDDGAGEFEEPDAHALHHATQQGGGSHNASDTAAAAMAQFHTMTIPQTTESTFLAQDVASEQQATQPFQQASGAAPTTSAAPGRRHSSDAGFDATIDKDGPSAENGEAASPSSALGPNGPKPSVGSEEWHKVRRDNHKEVERRRRETINEGINELAKIVPDREKNHGKNKGSILIRAVQFITQLKENETQNIEKWTLEKLLTEQAIAELSSSCDKLKAECQRAWAECEQWKKAAQKNSAVGGKTDGEAVP